MNDKIDSKEIERYRYRLDMILSDNKYKNNLDLANDVLELKNEFCLIDRYEENIFIRILFDILRDYIKEKEFEIDWLTFVCSNQEELIEEYDKKNKELVIEDDKNKA